MEITVNGYHTMILAALLMLIGHWLVFKIRFLSDYNIPEPVAGGLLAAIVVYLLNALFGLSFDFSNELQTTCMLMFFASIGLSADFQRLQQGGKPLVVFIVIVALFIVVQNIVGVGLAASLDLPPLLGLVTGSISLTGGHGTAAAWGAVLESKFGVVGATTIGMATATFGLVIGGMVGGPVARYLIKKQGLKPLKLESERTTIEAVSGHPKNRADEQELQAEPRLIFDMQDQPRLINAYSAIQTLAMFAGCLSAATLISTFTSGTWLEMPTFIWALASGVIIRNALTYIFNFTMFDRAIDVLGSTCLALFLVIALLSLRLWELADLAGPVLIIVAAQTVLIMAYAIFITYRFMGADYDSTVLAAGHCGFGMGATPTAIANMQAVTDKFGPSYKAYLIVPLVGAFFVDIINAAVLQAFLEVPFLH